MAGLPRWFSASGFGVAVLVLAACGCHSGFGPRRYDAPEAGKLLGHLADLKTRASTLTASTRTNAFINGERANVDVDILAAWGGKLRYQAMNPGGASGAADLASDGTTVCFIDANANCGACGPATAENVGQLLQVDLPPDDVVATMFGGTPVMADPVETTVSWDEDDGQEVITLRGADGSVQVIQLDGRNQTWDVNVSELKGPDGKRRWLIQHKDFHVVKKPDGGTLRLPGNSRFVQGANEVRLDWRSQRLDRPAQPAWFELAVPDGLPACGR